LGDGVFAGFVQQKDRRNAKIREHFEMREDQQGMVWDRGVSLDFVMQRFRNQKYFWEHFL
jgi:hypothetical protein